MKRDEAASKYEEWVPLSAKVKELSKQIHDPNPRIALEAIRQLILTPEGNFARNPMNCVAVKGEPKKAK